jgi:hypothetical protein
VRHTARVRSSVRPLLLATTLACTPTAGQTTGDTGDVGTTGVTTGGIFLPTSTTTGGSSETGPAAKLDLPPTTDLPNNGGCGAVDVLFVIDNSKSMGPYQMALAAAFPEFVDAILANVPENVDLHVGVTTTDFTCQSGGADPCCPEMCPVGNTMCQIGSTPEEVDLLMSFYQPPTGGSNGSNGGQGRLFIHEGMTYFALNTNDDPGELKAWFTGAAVGAGEQGSSLEMPVAAAGYAVGPANAMANDGFLRASDAILLIVFLTNDPDASLESIATYRDMVLAAKGDCPECILTAGLLKECVPAENQRLWQFMTSFGDEPIWGDIEEKTGYAEVVGLSLAGVLADACENIPVG